MNRDSLKAWLLEAAAQFLEGAADAFLAISAGGALATAAIDVPTMGLTQLLISVATSGAIYVASFIKKNPRPGAYLPPVAQQTGGQTPGGEHAATVRAAQ